MTAVEFNISILLNQSSLKRPALSRRFEQQAATCGIRGRREFVTPVAVQMGLSVSQ
jgi:hypothetical protein